MTNHISREEVEAAARAIHRTFWLRSYGDEIGTAEVVIRQTWEAAREARMAEAEAGLKAALASRPAPAAPKGWQLVPKKPTHAMCLREQDVHAYRYALSHAPTAPAFAPADRAAIVEQAIVHLEVAIGSTHAGALVGDEKATHGCLTAEARIGEALMLLRSLADETPGPSNEDSIDLIDLITPCDAPLRRSRAPLSTDCRGNNPGPRNPAPMRPDRCKQLRTALGQALAFCDSAKHPNNAYFDKRAELVEVYHSSAAAPASAEGDEDTVAHIIASYLGDCCSGQSNKDFIALIKRRGLARVLAAAPASPLGQDDGYVRGLQEAGEIIMKMFNDQHERPNAGVICGWLHVEICERIHKARGLRNTTPKS